MAIHGALQGEKPGKKVISGSFTPTGTSTSISWRDKLGSVDRVVCSLEAVDMTHMWSVAGVFGDDLTFVHYKPTATNNVTPAPATTPWNVVNWIAIGDAPR